VAGPALPSGFAGGCAAAAMEPLVTPGTTRSDCASLADWVRVTNRQHTCARLGLVEQIAGRPLKSAQPLLPQLAFGPPLPCKVIPASAGQTRVGGRLWRIGRNVDLRLEFTLLTRNEDTSLDALLPPANLEDLVVLDGSKTQL
jgi:hypothetical protein